jgi:hypothetical protein
MCQCPHPPSRTERCVPFAFEEIAHSLRAPHLMPRAHATEDAGHDLALELPPTRLAYGREGVARSHLQDSQCESTTRSEDTNIQIRRMTRDPGVERLRRDHIREASE